MPGGNATEKNTLATDAELTIKLVTFVLGVLYVLGLIVSNMHLMKLGISDFTSLQARNIMTGFLFVFYTIFLLLVLLPIPIGIYFCGRTFVSSTHKPLGKFAKCLGIVLAVLFMTGAISWFAGILFGYMYPWGRTWDAGFTRSAWTWQFIVSDFKTGYVQFFETFRHPKIISASFLIILALLPLVFLLVRRYGGDREDNFKSPSLNSFVFAAVTSSLLKPVMSLTYLFVALPLLLVGFAQEVYPNIPSNFGGGQPDIAELQIGTDNPAAIRLPGIDASSTVAQQEDTVITAPVVIWYQSDKFLYLASLTADDHGSAQLVALDLKLVRTIRYLPKSVRVASGGRILSIHAD
ncbi:MAG: hypothetical protein KKA54_08740 [Proteobacteria bacterium]|nr:hypothetical protein [Pseudomonadota bacterium]MBU0966455.1 hypothetical protein [Pseudomonadota bacterium]